MNFTPLQRCSEAASGAGITLAKGVAWLIGGEADLFRRSGRRPYEVLPETTNKPYKDSSLLDRLN